jgi:phenylalanyl-tRNA synthetase beta chain
MRVPFNWLNEHVKIDDLDLKHIEERLIMSGSNTEGVKDFSEGISKVVIGYVVSQEKHPDADTLFVLMVDVGEEEHLQIITGADNVSVGDYVPVAVVGAWLHGGLKIKRGKLRGMISNGMLCSLDELGFERSVIPKQFDNGIYILQGEYKPGEDFYSVVPLGDSVIEFEITPNRPDCLSIEGMAREAQATFERTRKALVNKTEFEKGEVDKYFRVEVKDFELCPRFAGFVMRNVVIKPSPQWMQIRLMHAGVRPINNIVDVTNYTMLEIGQPIHPYDMDMVDNQEIIVRRAEQDEKVITLDSVERTMTSEDLLITTREKPIGIAGVMGGENTEITENTKNVFIEVASFNKTAVRLTSKTIGLRTEASARFEKGIDPERTIKAISRMLDLYRELEVGEIVEGVIDIHPEKQPALQVSVTIKELKRILGINLSTDVVAEYLERLEFKLVSKDAEGVTVEVPTFRLDIEKEFDLIEEVARMYGYDKIPVTIPETTLYGELNERQKLEKQIRDLLVSNNLYEISTYSFVSPTAVDKINRSDDESLNQFVRLINPLGEEYSVMRTTLLPNMLEVMVRNYNNGNDNMFTFELGNTFFPKSLPITELPIEKKSLCIGVHGKRADFFVMKGLVELLLNDLGIKGITLEKTSDVKTYHPGRSAQIVVDGEVIGILGEVHPKVLGNYSMDQRIIAAELDFEKLAELASMDRLYHQLPRYPSIERDIAILVKENITNQEIVDIIEAKGGKNLISVNLFDVYRGVQILIGHKSLAYNMLFRSDERTLTDEEVQKPYEKILNALEEELGASRR